MKFDSRSHGYPRLAMFVDGEWVEGGGRRTHQVVNPATCDTIGEMPLANAADLDRALEASRRGFHIWRNSAADERSRVLAGAARLMRERVEQIAGNVTLEQGKLLVEAKNEVLASAALFDFYAGEAKRIYGRVLSRPSGARSLVVKEPIGPVAAFTPWNFPVDSPARKLGAPIAAGCSVILKPAEEAPASAIAVIQALLDAGLPKEVAQLVCGVPDEVSRHLLASPIIRKASFTGSTAVGKHLMRLCADTMKRTTMELGGHAPVIIFDDADVDKAVNILVATKYRNAGQVCVSPTRFYVQDGIYDRFVSAFSSRVEKINIGDGLDETSMMGPTANPRRPVALEGLIADAVSHGARVRVGGERPDGKGFFFRPTVLSEVTAHARIMNEEPFGPIALTARFSTFDEVVEQANRLPFGLAAFAFTENGRRANLIADAIEAGMVGINTTVIRYADSPFQGVKESGHGSEDGPEGVDACLVTKSIHQI
ncbi:NAD-dependent succinate-semialdehyde dehydrogenase [Paraburkholderia sp. D15]|uniref:NAD-dependent succinate-semialdehyde dehydrogenase n=1 Tax=Paraburkholderia sp. D15 TaxID=2880218 RepID=UPI00247B0605|nr:NAD-dependent succinate-semialdehyde dehydrogenase [Paraburkholderia sp. D15]WGS54688.1 NAD-dependent succinate-semialdehyde dehydrogenase [Paraburkholderia sp. D15]